MGGREGKAAITCGHKLVARVGTRLYHHLQAFKETSVPHC